MSEPVLSAGLQLRDAVARESLLARHPPEKSVPPRSDASDQIAIVTLRQAQLLWSHDDHVQSKASDAIQVNSVGQLQKVPISRRTKFREEIDCVTQKTLRATWRSWVSKNAKAALCTC